MKVKLIHERDTKNFAVYSTEPQGLFVRDQAYLHLDALKAENAGKVPETLTLTITTP